MPPIPLPDMLDAPPPEPDGSVPGVMAVWWSIRRIVPIMLDWRECPDQLATALKSARDSQHELAQPQMGLQPRHGYITQYPLYSALWAQPVTSGDDADVPVGRIGQAALLVASAILSDADDGGLNRYRAPLQRACLAVRRMLSGNNVPHALAEIPCPGSLANLVTGLDQILGGKQEAELSAFQHRMVSGIRAFLVDALEGRAPRHRSRGSISTTLSSNAATPEPDDPTPQYTLIEASSPHQRSSSEGAAPIAEYRGRSMALVEGAEEDANAALSSGQMWHRAKYRSRAIAAASQGLLLGSDRLQLVDLAGLHATLTTLLDGSWTPSINIRLGAAVVCISLLSGRKIEQLADLYVVPRSIDLAEHIKHVQLDLQARELHLPIPELRNAFTPNEEEAALYRQTIDTLVVRLPRLTFSDFALELLVQNGRKRPFRIRQIRQYAQDFCAAVNSRTAARTTLHRIEHFVARQVYAMSGDWADAALISATENTSDARLYYYTPTTQSLETKYDAVWIKVTEALGVSRTRFGPQYIVSRINLNPHYVGSRCCPEDAHVQQLASTLAKRCSLSLTGRRGPNRTRDAHNALALYTCLLLMWHTGVREVQEPIELTQYDPITGFLAISDKDSDSYHASRVAWVTPLAQQQIRKYWVHTDSLPDSTRANGNSIPDRALFFLNESNERVAVTPDSLRTHLADYPFRLNAQRHYLRTRLRELGVPGQTVDALFGHGAPGQEPYASHSCYSPDRLRADTQDALETLARRAGWVVLPRN